MARMSDFKANEEATLSTGQPFEPTEENPRLGSKRASPYHSALFFPLAFSIHFPSETCLGQTPAPYSISAHARWNAQRQRFWVP